MKWDHKNSVSLIHSPPSFKLKKLTKKQKIKQAIREALGKVKIIALYILLGICFSFSTSFYWPMNLMPMLYASHMLFK